ncbi:MAG: TlpA family protein disulfide reductase [Phycisphaerae bacterium]|jgi:thiol-disulfide isomerase/thioredoxin|nr:TlpA family protein disulfide reductase [Phycisphaerae bacterium]
MPSPARLASLVVLSGSMCGSTLFAAAIADEAAKLTVISSGASAKIGYYAPIRATLSSEKPATVTKVPEGLEAPLFGTLPVAGVKGRVFHVIVDEPAGKEARLFVDANGDGDLTNDAAAEWKSKKAKGKPGDDKEYTTYNGGATLLFGGEGKTFDAHINAYRFDPNDPGRAQLKDVLLFYRDYAVEGELPLGGKSYKVMLDDGKVSGDFSGKAAGSEGGSAVTLLIDVNGNGKFDHSGESFPVDAPFNIAGTTWELADIAADGSSMRAVKSTKTVEAVPTPPDLAVGKKILSFEEKDLEGKTVRFPDDYKGKVVLLDFWATWCGPCMLEMPNVVKAYEAYHDKGFEVLGVTLDSKDAVEKIRGAEKDKGMKWPQIYDGGGWKAKLATQFSIHSIPQAYLVDGNTGEILATGDAIRGEQLAKSIEAALAKRKNG